MSGTFSFAPSEDALPPSEVRFNEVHVEQWPDGNRVRVHVKITPFQQRPDLEATILDALGNEIADTLIIETPENSLVFTMHLNPTSLEQNLSLKILLTYRNIGIVDKQEISFMTHAMGSSPA